MPFPHTGHDHDCDLTPECPGCGEVTPCPGQHTCLPGRRPDGAVYDTSPITFYDYDPPPECDHQWAEAAVTYEHNGQRIPVTTDQPIQMCATCGAIALTKEPT